jgi:hypothetical protein
MRIRILLNQTRDGRCDGYQHGQDMAEVYAYDETSTSDVTAALERAFFLFNVGDDPSFGQPDPIALAYRKLRNRSLSVGDVVICDGEHHAVERCGWQEVAPPVITPAHTRLRYVYSPGYGAEQHQVVLGGRLDADESAQLERLLARPSGDGNSWWLNPDEIGLPDLRERIAPRDEWADSYIHSPWHAVTSVTPTQEPPTEPITTARQLVRRLADAATAAEAVAR